nr:VOC family protein [Actinopolyspora xinjiangensis]
MAPSAQRGRSGDRRGGAATGRGRVDLPGPGRSDPVTGRAPAARSPGTLGKRSRASRTRHSGAALRHALRRQRGRHREHAYRNGAVSGRAAGQPLPVRGGGRWPGAYVDVLVRPRAERGLVAAGTVHHVAWRAPDEATQAAWRSELADNGVSVTSVLDRQYFRSVYFREPGGTLLEIATDEPGFTADEPLLELGRALKLPPWLEPSREQIEAALPGLDLPSENNPRRSAP